MHGFGKWYKQEIFVIIATRWEWSSQLVMGHDISQVHRRIFLSSISCHFNASYSRLLSPSLSAALHRFKNYRLKRPVSVVMTKSFLKNDCTAPIGTQIVTHSIQALAPVAMVTPSEERSGRVWEPASCEKLQCNGSQIFFYNLSEQGLHFSLRALVFVFIGTWVLERRGEVKGSWMYSLAKKDSALLCALGKLLYGHGLQLRAHSYSVRLTSTTHFQLLRTQGHVFSYRDTPLDFNITVSVTFTHIFHCSSTVRLLLNYMFRPKTVIIKFSNCTEAIAHLRCQW
jgi:hypothetical protein